MGKKFTPGFENGDFRICCKQNLKNHKIKYIYHKIFIYMNKIIIKFNIFSIIFTKKNIIIKIKTNNLHKNDIKVFKLRIYN